MKEMTRFFMWLATLEVDYLQTKPDHIAEFRRFLSAPSPQKTWISNKKHKKNHPDWRPFHGPLSPQSAKTSIAFLRAFYRFLSLQKLIDANPFDPLKLRFNSSEKKSFQKRMISKETRSFVSSFFDTPPQSLGMSPRALGRARLIFYFGFHLAARRAEIAATRFSDIFQDKDGDWWWRTVGKGDKYGEVPVSDELLTEIIRYRNLIGLSGAPKKSEKTPIFSNEKFKGRPISPHRVWEILRDVCRAMLEEASCLGSPDQVVSDLSSISTHWLRHTSAAFQLNELGLTLVEVRDNLRHVNVATTSGYLDQENRIRHQKVKKATF